MRKYAILFAAGALVSLSACSDNSNNTPTQAQIDSAANAAAAAREAQMKATNDSLINAMAVMKADSSAKADSLAKVAAFEAGKAAGAAKQAKSTKTKTKVVAKKPVKTTQDTKFENRSNGGTKISEEKKKEQDDKFNRRGGN